MPKLRWSLFCGEALPSRGAVAWQSAAPISIVENLYGPTELTIACFVYRWDSATSLVSCRNDLVPIGGLLERLGAVVVDDQLHPVCEGVPGELCVCGPQTTPGYWKDAEKLPNVTSFPRPIAVKYDAFIVPAIECRVCQMEIMFFSAGPTTRSKFLATAGPRGTAYAGPHQR